MITRKFHPNPKFDYMQYHNGTLSISFKRTKGQNGQVRCYECDSLLAHKLYYQPSASKELEFYSNEIKGKLKVITVK